MVNYKQLCGTTTPALLFLIVLTALVGMTMFEVSKQLIHPDIGIWESHIVTILFTTCVAFILGFWVLRRYSVIRWSWSRDRSLKEQLEKEVVLRRTNETDLRKLAQAVEQSPNAIIITDLDGKIEYVNPSFSRISGYAANEALGQTPNLLKSGQTSQQTYDELWQTISSGKPWRGELKNRKKDGRLYWDQLSISPIKDDQNRITHYLGIQTDITERKLTEDKLRESENRVRAIVDTAAEGIITVDQSGHIESFNPAAERIFGYSKKEVIGNRIDVLIPAYKYNETEDQFANQWQLIGGKSSNSGHELFGRRKDGATFPMELAVSEFHDGVGSFYAGIVRDVTERIQMEVALKEERNFIDAVLATSAALIMVLDNEGKIVRFNHACEETMGYAFEEVKGKAYWDYFLAPEDAESSKSEFAELLAGQFPYHQEQYWLTKDGRHRLISCNRTALVDDNDKVEFIISTGIDITERRQAEEQARERQAELAHMDRLSLMGEMASSLAHELNQPLTSIYAYAQASLRMLQDGREKSQKFANAIEQTAKRAEQAGEIIRRIRRFVRKEGIKKTRVNLNVLIEETLEFTKREIREKGVTLLVDRDDQLPLVSVDGVQIQQVLLNLIRNSIEALREIENPAISVSTQYSGDKNVRVTVRDSGPGLEQEQIDRIYDAFHTTKENGMGMGLAISRSIIEAHNGRLWAESQSERGAIFHFTLPVTEED